ncbi:MAG: hypothetical protein ACT4OK_01115 [Gemmobacter sp.]
MLHDFDSARLRKSRSWQAVEGSTGGTASGGFRNIAMAGGTATAVAFSAATRTGRLHRVSWVTAATAGVIVTLRNTVAEYGLSDGFSVGYRFKISDAADVAGARMFLGVRVNDAALTNVDPGGLINVAGIGHNSGETTLRVYGADGTPATPVDLGSDFPALGSVAGVHDFMIHGCGADGVFWRAEAWADAVDGEPLATASGQFARYPALTSGVTALMAMRTNNATASAVALDLASVYISSL